MSRRPLATTDRMYLASIVRARWPNAPLRYYRSQFFEYVHGGYTVVHKDEVERFVWVQLDDIYNELSTPDGGYDKPAMSTPFVHDVRKAVQVQATVPGSTVLPAIVEATTLRAVAGYEDDEAIDGPSSESGTMAAFRNGVLNLPRLLEHYHVPLFHPNPAIMTVHAFPFAYDYGALCPLWMETVQRIFDGDEERIALLQEIFGYCLRAGNPKQRFFQFEGPARTGKSTVVRLLRDLIGAENMSHVPLEQFNQRFQLVPTIGKLVNVSSDPSSISPGVTALVKQFSGEDVMHIDRKGLDAVSALATAKLMITCNAPPAFQDHSEGIWRRLIRLPFTCVVPEEFRDDAISDKLALELPGVFNWAVDGLRRIAPSHAQFSRSSVADSANAQAKQGQDAVSEWLSDHVVEDEAEFLIIREFWNRYVLAMKSDNEIPLTKQKFNQMLLRKFPKVWRDRQRLPSGVEYVWWGIGWRTE